MSCRTEGRWEVALRRGDGKLDETWRDAHATQRRLNVGSVYTCDRKHQDMSEGEKQGTISITSNFATEAHTVILLLH